MQLHSTRVPATCPQCGQAFKMLPCEAAYGRRFCSRKCRLNYDHSRATARDIINQRFWSNVDKSGDCWLWQGLVLNSGYGQFYAAGKRYRAHRYSWILAHGPIPEGLSVCHTCDNPLCVNPDHLWLGTTLANQLDAVRKGRKASGIKSGAYTHPEQVQRGETHPSAKLTEADVLYLRRIWRRGHKRGDGTGITALARAYGMSTSSIQAAISGKTWKHLTSPQVP